MTTSQRTSLAGLQVGLGMTAHAAATGCLPVLSTLAVAVPALTLALLVLSSQLRAAPRAVALVAGQGVVHAATAAAATCVGGGAAHAGSDAPAWVSQLMLPAHVIALLLAVAAAAHVERAVTFAGLLAVQLLGGLRTALALLTRTGACRRGVPRLVARGSLVRLGAGCALAQAGPRAPPAGGLALVPLS